MLEQTAMKIQNEDDFNHKANFGWEFNMLSTIFTLIAGKGANHMDP